MSLAEEVLAKRVQELEKQIEAMTETAVQRENLLFATEKDLAQARTFNSFRRSRNRHI